MSVLLSNIFRTKMFARLPVASRESSQVKETTMLSTLLALLELVKVVLIIVLSALELHRQLKQRNK